jgi:adenylate cyclase
VHGLAAVHIGLQVVVLADEQDRQLPPHGEVGGLVKDPFAGRSVAEEHGDNAAGRAAAEFLRAVRIEYAVQEYRYCLAARQRFAESTERVEPETHTPLPGLPEAGSQMAVPRLATSRLLAARYVESPLEQRFTYGNGAALVVLVGQLALAIELLAQRSDQQAEVASRAAAPPAAGAGT